MLWRGDCDEAECDGEEGGEKCSVCAGAPEKIWASCLQGLSGRLCRTGEKADLSLHLLRAGQGNQVATLQGKEVVGVVNTSLRSEAPPLRWGNDRKEMATSIRFTMGICGLRACAPCSMVQADCCSPVTILGIRSILRRFRPAWISASAKGSFSNHRTRVFDVRLHCFWWGNDQREWQMGASALRELQRYSEVLDKIKKRVGRELPVVEAALKWGRFLR